MTRNLLAIAALIAIAVIFIAGILVGGLGRPIMVSMPGVMPGTTAPVGGTIYNRIIEFSEGITVDGTTRISGTGDASFASSSSATTSVTQFQVSGEALFASDLTVSGTFLPAYVATTTTTTLATTTVTKLDVEQLYVSGSLSVTGTSTLGLDLIVDTNILYVDTYGNMVGIVTSTPNQALTVVGSISATGALILDSTADITGTTTLATTTVAQLQVSGETILSSNLFVTGETNAGRFIQGGSALALTSASTTLTAAQLCDNSIITQTASTSKHTTESLGTYILPATTTLYADCLTANGDTMTLLFRNATSSYGASTTIAADNSTLLLEPSGGNVIILPNEWALLEFRRIDAKETAVTVTSIQDAD